MARGKCLALSGCLLGLLAIAGCSTCSHCTSCGSHARAPMPADSQAVASELSGQQTAFATLGLEPEETPVLAAAVEKASAQVAALPQKIAKVLPPAVSAETDVPPPQPPQATKTVQKQESILSAVAREFGYDKTAQPTPTRPQPGSAEARTKPADEPREEAARTRRLAQRGPGIARRQVGRLVEAVMTDGRQPPKPHAPSRPQQPPRKQQPPEVPAVTRATPAPAPQTAAVPAMDKIHRDATMLPELSELSRKDNILPRIVTSEAAKRQHAAALASLQNKEATLPPVATTAEPTDDTLVTVVTAAPAAPAAPAKAEEVVTTVVQTSAKTPPREDLQSLSGEVQQWRKNWRLRYASIDEADQHGGSIVLGGHSKLDTLQDGQRVRVLGRIVDGESRVFMVHAFELVER